MERQITEHEMPLTRLHDVFEHQSPREVIHLLEQINVGFFRRVVKLTREGWCPLPSLLFMTVVSQVDDKRALELIEERRTYSEDRFTGGDPQRDLLLSMASDLGLKISYTRVVKDDRPRVTPAAETYRSVLEGLCRQFATLVNDPETGRLGYSTGELSVLEEAFGVLGWNDPRPCPELECQIDECHREAVHDINTFSGRMRVCGPCWKKGP